MLGEFNTAIGHFTTAITKEPENLEYLQNRADCYFELGKHQSAIEDRQKRLSNYQSAIEDLRTGLQYNKHNPRVLFKLGSVYFAAENYKKCTTTMKESLKNRPFLTYEPDIYYIMGLAYCRLEKFEKAIFPYSKCIERLPTNMRYVHERAKAYQMIGWHEEAVTDFDLVIKKNPKNAHAHFRRAFSLKALKVSPYAWLIKFVRDTQRRLMTFKRPRISTLLTRSSSLTTSSSKESPV